MSLSVKSVVICNLNICLLHNTPIHTVTCGVKSTHVKSQVWVNHKYKQSFTITIYLLKYHSPLQLTMELAVHAITYISTIILLGLLLQSQRQSHIVIGG